MVRRRRAVVGVVVALVVLVGGGAAIVATRIDEGDGPTGPWGRTMGGVCAARTDAADGNLSGAKRRFDDAHDGVHALATTADRGEAASLLRDTSAVEAALRARADAGASASTAAGASASTAADDGADDAGSVRALRAALDGLVASVRAAAASTGDDPGPCR